MKEKLQSQKNKTIAKRRTPSSAQKKANYSSSPFDRLRVNIVEKHILYLDTSEEKATLALYHRKKGRTFLGSQGLTKVKQIKWFADRELSKTLSIKYSYILENTGILQKDLSGVCVFVGPGSFTGLRIGISFANALTFGLGIPIYETKERGKINLSRKKELVVPFYGSQPRTTKPKNK